MQKALFNLVGRIRDAREREFRYLRKYTSDAAREYLDSQIVWIAGIECGDPPVLYETALRLRDGDGLPQHRPTARTWFERAGDHGVPEGYYAAARMEFEESDAPVNRIMGEYFLKNAARKEFAGAQRDLGMRLIEAGPKYGGAHQGYHWLLQPR